MTVAAPEARRIPSIDIVRGAVMVLMALDHVRVFAAVPAGGPSPGIFLTRWVTNFVAPAFIFLAGTSAWLYGRTHPDVRRFLVTRGLLLVLLELTLIRFAWTFNFDYHDYVLAGVIWAIGWSMVILAVLIRLPVRAIAVIALLVIAAGVEAFWSSARWVPPAVKYGVGAMCWVFVLGYLAWQGRPAVQGSTRAG